MPILASFRGANGPECLAEDLPDYVTSPPVEAVVFGFGVSEDGQLGVDTEEDVKLPKVIEALLGTRFCGRGFTRAPLIGGSRSSLGLDAEGQVLAWGWNARATLGLGYVQEKVRKPRRVQSLSGVKIAQITMGGWHCLAVSEQGQAYSWGGNEYGQCALPTDQKDVLTPTRCVPHLQVTQVAAGGMHSCALTSSGDVWTWGEPWGNFNMDVDRRPKKVPGAQQIAKISCGAFHTLALTKDGKVLSWGINDFGQLGSGTTVYETKPTKVQGLEDEIVADIAAGGWHSLALTSKGEVYIWGRGEYGRLGLGDQSSSSKLRPCKVPGLEGHRVVQASCGGTHSMVLTDEGRIFGWGRSSFGRLGKSAEKDCVSPEEIRLPGGPDRWRVISVCCGGRHSLALALPDNEPASLRSQQNSRRNSAFDSSLDDLPLGEPLRRPTSAFLGNDQSPNRNSAEGVHSGEEGDVRISGDSSPQDLVSVMERQEAEEEAAQIALNGGIEPGSAVDYVRNEDSSSGVSPGGDSPVTGSTHSDAMQQQIHQVLSTQGLRDGLTDD